MLVYRLATLAIRVPIQCVLYDRSFCRAFTLYKNLISVILPIIHRSHVALACFKTYGKSRSACMNKYEKYCQITCLWHTITCWLWSQLRLRPVFCHLWSKKSSRVTARACKRRFYWTGTNKSCYPYCSSLLMLLTLTTKWDAASCQSAGWWSVLLFSLLQWKSFNVSQNLAYSLDVAVSVRILSLFAATSWIYFQLFWSRKALVIDVHRPRRLSIPVI